MTSPVDLLKSLHKRRLTRRGRPPREDSEDELGEAYYEHQITDDKVSIRSLKYDKRFWQLFTSKEEFRTSIIQSMIAHGYGVKVEPFFDMVLEKTAERELGVSCQQKIYFKFIDLLVDGNEPAILDEFLAIFSCKVRGDAGSEEEVENLPCMVRSCKEDNYPLVTCLVRHGFRLRCKALQQDLRTIETEAGHLDDQVYRLHILRAMARPCYIMACYCTVGERNRPVQPERQESTISNSSLSSMSSFSWKKESILNLASISGSETSKRSKHFLTSPGEKQFRTEADCSVHHECNDPIYRCFALKTMAEDLAEKAPEYREEYEEVASSTEHFATMILSQCRNSEEVDSLLTDHLQTKSKVVAYPKLRMAVETGQKEFVGHMYSQQVLAQQWVGESGWAHFSLSRKVFHCTFQLLLTPILCLGFLIGTAAHSRVCGRGVNIPQTFKRSMDSCYFFNSLKSPINRCISHFSSLITIMALIIVAVFHPISRCGGAEFNMYPARVALIIMIAACVVKEIEDFSAVRSFKIYFQFDFWRTYRIVNHWSIIMAIAIQIHLELRIHHAKPNEKFENEAYFSDAMFAIATTISVLHFLYWIQLHNTMGPIVISVSKVLRDVLTISVMYIIVLLAFTCGIVFMGSGKIKTAECKRFLLNETFVRRLQPEEPVQSKIIRNFYITTETMLWALLGPGQEFKENDPMDLISSQGFFSLILMAAYQIISAVIFMNLLIAIMNTTLQEVQDKKQLYWKFVRAGLWIRFFDDNRALPPPYNLLNFCLYLQRCLKERLCSSSSSQGGGLEGLEEVEATSSRGGSIQLTKELLQRYASEQLRGRLKEREVDLQE